MIGELITLLKNSFLTLKTALKSKYNLLFIFYFLWLYRVEFMPADGSGIAKSIQIISTLAILYFTLNYNNNIIRKAYWVKDTPYKSLLLLYTYATISAFFSVMPQFAFFLAFQNVVILITALWFFSLFKDFKSLEKAFLLFSTTQVVLEAIIVRIVDFHSLVIHFLGGGSMSALIISYTAGELLANRVNDKQRKRFLKSNLLINVINIILCTSSGANASAVFGVGVGMILSGNIFLSLVLIFLGAFLYLNQDLINNLIMFIMPGKTMKDIETSTGRERIWELLIEYANKKPWFGWGFGCIERVVSDTGRIGFKIPDAHSNYIGFYGSLGYIGSIIAYIHLFSSWIYSFRRRLRVGFTGLTAAVSCAIMNGYSYAFLASKACSITVIYFALICIMFYFSRVRVYDIKADK